MLEQTEIVRRPSGDIPGDRQQATGTERWVSSSCICTTDLESQKLEARAGGSSTSTRGTGGPRTRSAVQVRMPGRSGMPAAASCGSLCSPAFSERVSFQSVPHFARTDSIPFDGFFGARDIQAPCRRVVWAVCKLRQRVWEPRAGLALFSRSPGSSRVISESFGMPWSPCGAMFGYGPRAKVPFSTLVGDVTRTGRCSGVRMRGMRRAMR